MSWSEFSKVETQKDYFKEIVLQVQEERINHEIYPLKGEVFNLFKMIEPEDVKVVILGQDPYPGYEVHNGQEIPYAMGLSFSVKTGLSLPKSLNNIFTELESDLGVKREKGNLSDWVKQGVFLLNTYLTVRKSQPMSHQFINWDIFTKNVLRYLLSINPNIIFILWGRKAQNAVSDLNIKYKIESTHPSPLSAYRGFFGSKPFSKTNELLRKLGETEIKWA